MVWTTWVALTRLLNLTNFTSHGEVDTFQYFDWFIGTRLLFVRICHFHEIPARIASIWSRKIDVFAGLDHAECATDAGTDAFSATFCLAQPMPVVRVSHWIFLNTTRSRKNIIHYYETTYNLLRQNDTLTFWQCILLKYKLDHGPCKNQFVLLRPSHTAYAMDAEEAEVWGTHAFSATFCNRRL